MIPIALTERDRRALKAGATGAAMIVAWVLFVRPLLGASAGSSQPGDSAALLASDLGVVKAGPLVGAAARDLRSVESIVSQVSIPERDINLAIRDLEARVADAAGRHGVIVDAMHNGTADTTRAGIVILRIDLSARAEFDAFIAFLHDLEHEVPWVGTNELSMTVAATSIEGSAHDAFSTDPLLVINAALFAVSAERLAPDRVAQQWP